jgi:methyl-accepting chemotaxis protein
MSNWKESLRNQLSIRNSISKKLILSFTLLVIVISLFFSMIAYKSANFIVDNQVLPEFDRTLKTNISWVQEKLDKNLVIQSDQGSNEAYNKLLSFLNEEKKQLGVENVYVLGKKEKTYIVALSEAADQRNAEYPFTDEMNKALQGSMQISSIYKDDFGVHKSVFVPIAGTHMILGIDMDAKFVDQLRSEIIQISIIVTGIMILLGSIAGYFLSKQFTKPLQLLVAHTQTLAKGDLRGEVRITSHDEMGKLAESFNQMKLHLKRLLEQVAATSEHVAASSKDLSDNTHMFTDMINQMTASLQEVSSGSETIAQGSKENSKAMEDMAKGIQHINESTFEVSEKSIEAAEEAGRGNQSIQQAVSQMELITSSVENSTELVRQMHGRANEIGHVVEFITSIADQINLLALNAAIEAARAGEYGRGFAVVADEVRKLAEKSSQSASEITNLLQEIQDHSLKSVEAMSQVTQVVASGSNQVRTAGDSFERISLLIDNVSQQIQNVSAVIQEISATSEQLSASAEETAQITETSLDNTRSIAATAQEQLAAIEEIAQATNTLSGQANQLKELVGEFKI